MVGWVTSSLGVAGVAGVVDGVELASGKHAEADAAGPFGPFVVLGDETSGDRRLIWEHWFDPARGRGRARGLFSVIDLADDAVIVVADDCDVRGPRPLDADGAVVGSVTGCSAG